MIFNLQIPLSPYSIILGEIGELNAFLIISWCFRLSGSIGIIKFARNNSMTSLCINDMRDISLSSISIIQQDQGSHKLYYSLTDTITCVGIPFKMSAEIIEDRNGYKISIPDESILIQIDKLISHQVQGYTSFIRGHSSHKYIEFTKTATTSDLVAKYKGESFIYLNIKFINRYNNTPILHIL